MPTELEIAAAEKAAREVAPRVGGFSARVVAKAALEAAEKVRMGGALRKKCPQPDGPGWTMQQCFDANRCACQEGILLGYSAKPYPMDHT